MQVINANDVKVYNVSAHKSLPEVNYVTCIQERMGPRQDGRLSKF